MALRVIPPPGSVLRHRIIGRFGISQSKLARAMGVSAVRINQIINGHAPITAEMALRLATVTGTVPEYWMELQSEFELYKTRCRLAGELKKLPRLHPK